MVRSSILAAIGQKGQHKRGDDQNEGDIDEPRWRPVVTPSNDAHDDGRDQCDSNSIPHRSVRD
jgi:hypothetical protein